MTTTLSDRIKPCTDTACGVHGRGRVDASKKDVCARQVLHAYGRGEAVVLLNKEPTQPSWLARQREIMPLSTGRSVQPGERETIVVKLNQQERPKLKMVALYLQRVFVSAANPGWMINSFTIGGKSQFDEFRDLPGEIFGGVAGASLSAFDVIRDGDEVRIEITRTGKTAAPFFGSLVGVSQHETYKTPFETTGRVKPMETTAIKVVADRHQAIRGFNFETPSSGGTADWIINDIESGGKSLFTQSGQIPADLFANAAIDSFVRYHPFDRGTEMTITATYVGVDPNGSTLQGAIVSEPQPLEESTLAFPASQAVCNPELRQVTLWSNRVERDEVYPEWIEWHSEAKLISAAISTAVELVGAAQFHEAISAERSLLDEAPHAHADRVQLKCWKHQAQATIRTGERVRVVLEFAPDAEMKWDQVQLHGVLMR